jgi:predicted secreted protein
MRYLVLAALLLAALLLAAGCTTTPPANATVTPTKTTAGPNVTTAVYTMNDSGKTVPLGLQQNLSIRLPENPTTGYSWNASVTSGLLITDTAYTPDAQPVGMTGVGGTRNWTVKGVGAGTQRFSAVYVRPWETNQTPADQFNLTVQVG